MITNYFWFWDSTTAVADLPIYNTVINYRGTYYLYMYFDWLVLVITALYVIYVLGNVSGSNLYKYTPVIDGTFWRNTCILIWTDLVLKYLINARVHYSILTMDKSDRFTEYKETIASIEYWNTVVIIPTVVFTVGYSIVIFDKLRSIRL